MMLLLQSAKANNLVPANVRLCNLVMKRVFGNDAIEFTEEEYQDYLKMAEVTTHAYTTNKVADQVIADIAEDDDIDDSYVEEANENNDNSQ